MAMPQWNGVRWVTGEQQLAELEGVGELLQQLTEHVRDVFWLTDVSRTKVHYASPAFSKVWGTPVDELYRDPSILLESIHPEDRERIEGGLRDLAGGNYDVEYRVVQPSGDVRWVRDRAFPVRGETGEIVRVAGISQDVTDRKDAERRLQGRERFYRTLFEHTNDLVTALDAQGRWLFQSRSVERVLGYAAGELDGRPALELVHPDDSLDVARMLKQLVDEPEESVRAEYRLLKKDGSYAFVDAVGINLLDKPDIGAIVICSRDVTARRMRDSLTGLASEPLLVHHLDLMRGRLADKECPFSVVMIGVDRFRTLNETLGEPMADRLLAKLAARLEELVPNGVVARLPGDRFAAILNGVTGTRHAFSKLQTIRAALARPYEIMDQSVSLTVCTGVVVAPSPALSAREMLRAAENALAEAKRAGPDNDEVFDETDRDEARRRFSLESALRAAITNNQIIAFYQPLLSLRTGRIVGFEALMRWDRPGKGLLAPGEFVPVAEESRLICELDMAVIRRSWTQLARWREQYPHFGRLSLSVNLSTRHFENNDLVGRLDALLLQTGAPPNRVKLEITETALVGNPADTATVMNALKSRGLHFGLDDFGTGYSSLSYLHKFPFRTLKIDQSFVGTLDTPDARPELVRAIVSLARSLGMRTVAEGIETEAQLSFLRELGCDYGQGYHIAHPLSAHDAERLLAIDPRW